MANRLKMAQHDAILQLYSLHWSKRRIARELGIDRATVARHLRRQDPLSNTAIPPAGSGPPNAATLLTPPGPGGAAGESQDAAASLPNPNAAIVPAGSDAGMRSTTGATRPAEVAVERPANLRSLGRRSLCEPFRQTIVEKLKQELTAQRIYQDLLAETDYRGGYDSVKRFVRRLSGELPSVPFRRMECAPGFEAQVDYGTGASVIGSDGKRRKTHVFRIVLSHSRKGYSEVSFRQTTEDFLRALENAFWQFGGVPRTIVIDNLKAAVQHPDWYDPELNPKLCDFCRHYGTVILPAKPYMARHKGKIERGVGYVKGNALKGRAFDSLVAENDHLAQWEQSVADTRIHGTTRQHVGQVFEELERPALLPLPAERFPFFQEGQRIVNRDGHVEVGRAYYSVPPEYLGRTVWVRWDARRVHVFNDRREQIALHARHEQGRFSTQAQHIVAQKINGLERGARWLLQKVRLIGPSSSAWSEAMLTARGIEGTRVLLGLMALTKKHSSSAIEQACQTALSHGEFRLRALRALIVRQPPVVQAALPFLDEHPLIRPLEDYAQIVASALARKGPLESPETRAAAACQSSLRFLRNGRADESQPHQQKDPDGNDHRGLREIHPPGSGYSSPGCAPAEPDSASPDHSTLRSLSPPLPGLFFSGETADE